MNNATDTQSIWDQQVTLRGLKDLQFSKCALCWPDEAMWYLFKSRRWVFSPTQIRQSPYCIPRHGQSSGLCQEPENQKVLLLICYRQENEGRFDWKVETKELTLIVVEGCCSSAHSPCTQHCPLQCYPEPTQPEETSRHKHRGYGCGTTAVSQQWLWDYYLFLDVLKVGVQQFYEDRHRSGLNHRLCLQGCSWRYVGERPGSFELPEHARETSSSLRRFQL